MHHLPFEYFYVGKYNSILPWEHKYLCNRWKKNFFSLSHHLNHNQQNSSTPTKYFIKDLTNIWLMSRLVAYIYCKISNWMVKRFWVWLFILSVSLSNLIITYSHIKRQKKSNKFFPVKTAFVKSTMNKKNRGRKFLKIKNCWNWNS